MLLFQASACEEDSDKAKMSVANKEEVYTHRLVPRLDEPAVGVPIKKRPVSLSGSSAVSSAPEVPLSAEEFSFSTARHDANVVAKEIDRSTAQLDEWKNQKFSALDLQLSSCRHGKNNYSSAVKKEKVDQGFSGFLSAQPHKNAPLAGEINAPSNISSGKLPDLDLNAPPDPADSDERLPAVNESHNQQFHGSIHYQNAQLPTMSSGPGRNMDSMNLPNTYRPSRKCGPDDVTLDLQLKPPARPEIGKSWKGLAPAPELSLSLSGAPMDEPMSLSSPNPLFNSEPVLSLKNVSKEAATPVSDKLAVEDAAAATAAAAPVPCKANPDNTSPTVTGTDKIVSRNNMVKKEPEEPSMQRIIDDVEKTRLLEQQSIRNVNNCAGYGKTDVAPQVPGKTQFDLNSDIFPNSGIQNGHGTSTDNVPIPGPSMLDTVSTKAMPVIPDKIQIATVSTKAMPVVPDKIQKSVKREESTSDVPSHAVAKVICPAAPTLLNSPPSGVSGASRARSSESSIQPLTSPLEPSFPSTVWKPPSRDPNAREHMALKPCDALQLQGSSNSIAEPLIHNSKGCIANDGTSQGSAEMDCSDDDDNTAFRLPSADRPDCGPSRSGLTTDDGINIGNLCKELKREVDSDTHQDCSSVANKVSTGDATDEHTRDVAIDEESKGNQLLKKDKTSALNSTDNNMHDVKTATHSVSVHPQRSLDLQNPASSKIGSNSQSPRALDTCLKKTRSLDIKSETSLSIHGKLAASSSEDCAKDAAAKAEHGTEIDEAASENSNEKSKPDSYIASSVSNERDGQLVGSHSQLRELGYAYVNRNERWERFMESEREKAKGGYQDGRHGPDMINQRRTDHRYGGRGTGSRGYPKNFRGPRMSNEHPFEDDLGHSHRIPHRRRHSPRDIDIDDYPGRDIPDPRLMVHGQMEDLPDDMIQGRFFRPHSHRRNAHGDHGFIHRERSHSPAQRRGAPMHFHRGRSPEAILRTPPLPHRCPNRRNGSPLDRIDHDERAMQRNTRCGRIGSRRALEEDAFEPPLHPAHVAGRHSEEELGHRRKYRDRRVHRRSLEVGLSDDDEMLSYHLEEEMEFAECGGPQEVDGRLRNRMGHRIRGEQEDSCRHRGPQGWRNVDSNDNRPKRRRY